MSRNCLTPSWSPVSLSMFTAIRLPLSPGIRRAKLEGPNTDSIPVSFSATIHGRVAVDSHSTPVDSFNRVTSEWAQGRE
jgi:hypothetical protein